MGYMKFDAEDFFLTTLFHAAQEPLTQKPYAPWLVDFLKKKNQSQYLATTKHGRYLPDVEAPAPPPSAPAVNPNDSRKSVSTKVGTSTSAPPPSASAPKANPMPLAGQFRDPMDNAQSDYFTENTDTASIHPDTEAPKLQTIREMMVEMKQQNAKFFA